MLAERSIEGPELPHSLSGAAACASNSTEMWEETTAESEAASMDVPSIIELTPEAIVKINQDAWVASSETSSLLLLKSPHFFRGGFCCVPVAWQGRQVSLGIAHIKFNRYVFLHCFYATNPRRPLRRLVPSGSCSARLSRSLCCHPGPRCCLAFRPD